ncbi:hypothetical protein BN946_scf184569.g16 [Trametes cinnabarina]|uniref:F-box domain-containing protein n=1 Tax=Pycnoporus cinnabarinus TaxID=5643 RepID=A0A060SDJ6_PYCCI|nr:hypothetical protein BN946_scf184569.g16 [Trametes cinnabarina]
MQFQAFLDAHPDIAGHVRSLMLRHPMDDQSGGPDGRPDASAITPQTLVRTAKRLPRLRECQFYFVHIVPSGTPTPDATTAEPLHAAPYPLIDLSVFHIFGSSHQETGPLLELLSYFRMDRLELELVTFVQEPATFPMPPAHFRRIEVRDIWADLDTADEEPIVILPALASALAPGILQALHCSWKDWAGCITVGNFLKDVGSTLTNLTLNMSVASWVEELGSAIQREGWECLNLGSCTALRTFRVNVSLPLSCPLPDVPDVKRRVSSYRNLFSLLPSTVHTVIINAPTMLRSSPPVLGGGRRSAARGQVPVDFSEIEHVLLDMPQMRRVVISIRPAQNMRGAAATVSKSFPALLARGVLEVRTGAMPDVR